jgi:hypothetical protein
MPVGRTKWLLLDNGGAPQGTAWGEVKTQAEEADSSKKSWAAALDDDQVAAGWDAQTTAWRRAPCLALPGWIDDAASGASLSSRTLTVAGVDYDLDDAGRTVKGKRLAPDATFVTIADAVALAESLGRDFDLVERTTLKKVRVWSTLDPGDPHPAGIDSGIYPQPRTWYAGVNIEF